MRVVPKPTPEISASTAALAANQGLSKSPGGSRQAGRVTTRRIATPVGPAGGVLTGFGERV
jgi:hypothetical protein